MLPGGIVKLSLLDYFFSGVLRGISSGIQSSITIAVGFARSAASGETPHVSVNCPRPAVQHTQDTISPFSLYTIPPPESPDDTLSRILS